jgi:hypothetical protein
MQPYVLEPDVALRVGLYPEDEFSQVIGDVVSSTWEGLRHKDDGYVQVWHYPQDRTIVIWECYFLQQFRGYCWVLLMWVKIVRTAGVSCCGQAGSVAPLFAGARATRWRDSRANRTICVNKLSSQQNPTVPS